MEKWRLNPTVIDVGLARQDRAEGKPKVKSVTVQDYKEKKGALAAVTLEDIAADNALLALAPNPVFKLLVIISFGLALSEPVLVGYGHQTLYAQKVVLGISTALFAMMHLWTMSKMKDMNVFKAAYLAILSETYIEIVCFALGWSMLYLTEYESFAALRCCRIFRFVWYTEFYAADPASFFYPLTYFMHIVIQYLEKIGAELLTTESKGGVVVLLFFFYLTYVVGVCFWWKTSSEVLYSPESAYQISECDTLPHCFLIMLRLTFWDGSGFDYLKSVMDEPGAGGQVLLLFAYMCFSAMVLLNGLIGIFSAAFQAATLEEEAEAEEENADRENGGEGGELEPAFPLTNLLEKVLQLEAVVQDMRRELLRTRPNPPTPAPY